MTPKFGAWATGEWLPFTKKTRGRKDLDWEKWNENCRDFYFWLCFDFCMLHLRHFLDIHLEMPSKQLDVSPRFKEIRTHSIHLEGINSWVVLKTTVKTPSKRVEKYERSCPRTKHWGPTTCVGRGKARKGGRGVDSGQEEHQEHQDSSVKSQRPRGECLSRREQYYKGLGNS